jgi:hypothetical protein
MQPTTAFDEIDDMLRKLAFADLYTEPEDNPFWNLEKVIEAKSLPKQIRSMEYIKGRYAKVFLQAHQDRYEEALRIESRNQADNAVSKAIQYVDKYLAVHLPEAYSEIQGYHDSPNFEKLGDNLISQARSIVGENESANSFNPAALVDRPQVTKGQAATILECSERYVDGLVKKYNAFPRPIQRLPDGMVYFWFDEILAFKAGKLYEEIERERRTKSRDEDNPDGVASKRQAPNQGPKQEQSGDGSVLDRLKAIPKKQRKAKRTKGSPPKDA